MIYSACPKQDSLLEKKPAAPGTRQPSRLGTGVRLQAGPDCPPCSGPSLDDSFKSIARLTSDDAAQFNSDLASLILERIQLRLPGRIRQLAVFTTENAVILTGLCCTFYTKQVAQHAAMGVLEYEQLINNIDVRTLK